MTARIQSSRFGTSLQRPAARPVGEFFVNFADGQFGVVDPAASARDLIAIRYHAATALYLAGDHVIRAGVLYRCKANIAPKAFAAGDWDAVATQAADDVRYLRLTGGALTGPVTTSSTITLAANPTLALQVAPKQYVDQRDALYLPLTGGVLTGPLTVSGGIAYAAVDPGLHRIAFKWDGTLVSYVDNTLVGTVALQSWVGGAFLPLVGGTLSGNLGISRTLVLNYSGAAFTTGDTATQLIFDGTLWRLEWARVGGQLSFVRGSDNAILFKIDGAGGTTVGGNLAANGSIGCPGAVSAGSITGGYVYSTGNVQADGSLTTSNDVNANGTVTATNALRALSGTMWFGAGGSGRIMQVAPDWYWDWHSDVGDLVWRSANVEFVNFRADGVLINNRGPMAGVGNYVNLSDQRGKSMLRDAMVGLDEILRLTPIEFTRVSDDSETPRVETGFSAQQVREVLPSAVHVIGITLPDGSGGLDTDEPTLGVSIDPIVAALVNATKTLAARVIQLENHRP